MASGFRYVSQREVRVIQARTPWRVPNVDVAGRPKMVYFSWDLYASTAQAEKARSAA